MALAVAVSLAVLSTAGAQQLFRPTATDTVACSGEFPVPVTNCEVCRAAATQLGLGFGLVNDPEFSRNCFGTIDGSPDIDGFAVVCNQAATGAADGDDFRRFCRRAYNCPVGDVCQTNTCQGRACAEELDRLYRNGLGPSGSNVPSATTTASPCEIHRAQLFNECPQCAAPCPATLFEVSGNSIAGGARPAPAALLAPIAFVVLSAALVVAGSRRGRAPKATREADDAGAAQTEVEEQEALLDAAK